ncbi:hypothetical protein [Nonomuraea sp. NEAU-A123]|uniref:hypothetical protein n=1 Tax=Nonomuraea sp. NEAU-A123 TaxID=2839649 RepID=UPI001BE4A214|nr:hypothetical protein [Nonomuraea sp. NEAU-A123]MBT2226292.1 hypothetical protein [Nonomuraea sp. NEAU-A123]
MTPHTLVVWEPAGAGHAAHHWFGVLFPRAHRGCRVCAPYRARWRELIREDRRRRLGGRRRHQPPELLDAL